MVFHLQYRRSRFLRSHWLCEGRQHPRCARHRREMVAGTPWI